MKKTIILITVKNALLIWFVFYLHSILPSAIFFGIDLKTVSYWTIALMTFFYGCNSDLRDAKKELDLEILKSCENIQKMLREAEIRRISKDIREQFKNQTDKTETNIRPSDIH